MRGRNLDFFAVAIVLLGVAAIEHGAEWARRFAGDVVRPRAVAIRIESNGAKVNVADVCERADLLRRKAELMRLQADLVRVRGNSVERRLRAIERLPGELRRWTSN